MNTATRCRAKNPSACRVHGSVKIVLNENLVYGSKAFQQTAKEVKDLEDVISNKAMEKILSFDQFNSVKQEIKHAEWRKNVTWQGHKENFEKALAKPSFENDFKLAQVEEAREEILARTPEVYSQVKEFDKVVEENALETITPATDFKYDWKTVKEIRNKLRELQPGDKVAVEFYDGSRFIATQEERPTLSQSLFKGEGEKDFIPSVRSVLPSLRLPSSNMLTDFADVKKFTILKPGVGEVFAPTGKEVPVKPTDSESGYYQVKSPTLEGVFYQTETMRFTGSTVEHYTSGSNVYRFDDTVSLRKL